MLFKRANAPDTLKKVRAELAAAQTKIAGLQVKRRAALLDADDVAAIDALDRQIEALRRTVGILNDRAAALAGECAELERERRERQRAAAIAVIEKKLAVRNAIAAELEAKVKEMGDLYFALLNAENIAANWPFAPPSPNFGLVDVAGIRRELGWLLYSIGRPIGGRSLFPEATSAGLGVAGISPAGLGASVDGKSKHTIAILRTAPIGPAAIDSDTPRVESEPALGLAALAT